MMIHSCAIIERSREQAHLSCATLGGIALPQPHFGDALKLGAVTREQSFSIAPSLAACRLLLVALMWFLECDGPLLGGEDRFVLISKLKHQY